MASSGASSHKADWNALAKRVAERKAGAPGTSSAGSAAGPGKPSNGAATPPASTNGARTGPPATTPAAAAGSAQPTGPTQLDEGSPQLQFRGFKPRSRPTSTVVPSPPNLGVPLALPALAPATDAGSRSATATLHVPYMGKDGERTSSGPVGGHGGATTSKPKSGPRLGGLGFMEDKGETLPPLQISLPSTTTSASTGPTRSSAQAAPSSSHTSKPPAPARSAHRPVTSAAVPIAPGRNPPRVVGNGTSPSGRHRQAHPDGGDGRPARRVSVRRHSKTKATLGGRAPPIDRDVEREVQEVLSKVPVDDPELVRAMLADILIRAQRGELNGAAPGSTLGLSASGGPDDPSPGSSTDGSTGSMPTTVTPPAVAQPQVPHPFAAAAHHTAASMKRSASSHSRSGSNVRPTSPSLSFTAKQRRRSSSLAGSTGSGRRLSWVPPPATPPPTAPLPMTPDEAAAAEAAKESQAASAIPEEPSTDVPSATATGVKPRQGALPLYRQNLDLAALGVPSATTGLGVSVPGPTPSVRADAGSMPSVLEADEVELTGKSFHRLSDDSPTPQSSSFGDYSMRNPGLPGLEELDDPESENHFWSQMERLGLASRLRSSVGEPVSGSETDEIVFGDDESRRAAQAARDREDVDLLARISLLRHDHHRNGSDSGSLFSIADSFATAQGSDDEVGEALSDDGSVYDGEDDGEDSYRRSPARVREMEAFPSGAASSPNQPQASTSSSPYVGGKDFDNSYRSGDSSSQATASTDALGPTTPRDSSPHMAQLEDSSRTREACLPPLAVGAAAGVTAGAVESGGRGEDEYHDTARETAIASEKARIDREDEVDYMDLADSGALMAVPRRSRVRREPVAASPAEPLAPPFPPPMRSRMPIVDTTHAAPADAAIDASSINAGTSKRMSVNVADLKAALANPAAATTTSTRASPSPSTSPSLAGPTSARVQRSFLPPPVQTELAPSKASSRSQSPKPEPIVEEIEDVSDAADAEEPAPNGDEAKSDDEHDSPMPGEARMLYQEPPSASWGFGGIGGIASGIAKLGSAAWGWGMSSVPDEVQQDDKDEEGRRRQRSVPGEFDSNRLSTTSSRLSGGSVRPDAALGSTSGRATPDEDELLEEWKDVIPFGVDPRQFIAEVRAAMRSTGTEPERGEAADIDLSEAPAVAAAVEEAAPGDEETAVVGSSGIDRAQLANAARGSPPLDTFADGVSPFGTLPAPEKPVRAKKRDTVPDATIDKAKRRSKAERRSMIITAPAQPPSIPLRTEVGSLSSTRRTVSSQSLSPSVDNMSITSSGTLTSKGSKRRKGIRSFFGGKAPPLPNSESDMSLNYARSTGSGSGDSSSPGRSRSVSDRDSPSIMSLLGNKQKVTTSQQIETDLGDMTYVSYDTGVSRSRSRSASVDVDSPQVDGSPGPTAGRPRKSSLKRQSRYDTPSRKASLTPVHAPIPEEDDKAIYGVRFANATRGLGLRSTAEEEAERAGGDYHALRWIGVGRGRYGELELTGEEDQDEFYAKQSEAIKAKWRAFGRQASTDWSRVRVD